MHYFEEIREKDPNEKDDTTIHYLELATGDKIVRRGSEPFDKLDTVYYKDQYGGVSVSFFDVDIGRRTCQRIIDQYGEQGNNCFLRNLKGIPPFVKEQFSPYQQLQLFRNAYGPKVKQTEQEKSIRENYCECRYYHNVSILRSYRKYGWKKDAELISKDITKFLLARNKQRKVKAKENSYYTTEEVMLAKTVGIKMPVIHTFEEKALKIIGINLDTISWFTRNGLPYPRYLDNEITLYSYFCNKQKLKDSYAFHYEYCYLIASSTIAELIELGCPIPQQIIENVKVYYYNVHEEKYNPKKFPKCILKNHWEQECYIQNKKLQKLLALCNHSIPELDKKIKDFEEKQEKQSNMLKFTKLKQLKKSVLRKSLTNDQRQNFEQEK